MEPVGKPVSEAMRGQPEGHARSQRGGWFIRILIPLLFLAAMVGVVYGVVSYMEAHQPQPRKPTNVRSDPSGSTVRKIQPEDDLPLAPVEPDESTPVIPPIPDPISRPVPSPIAEPMPDPMPLTPTDPSSSPDTTPSPTISALQVLEQFLDAATLDERLPHMEGRTSREELEMSCLAKPLPEHTIEPAMQSDNTLENYTDFVFKVTYAKASAGKDSYDMLVRRRGDQAPKVVTDPFLDLYGGRLLAFANSPGENKHGTFQVLVSANSSCSDTTVPNHDKKITLKLIPSLTGKEIVSAYAGKASAIGDMLDNDQSGLRWGRAKPCTILLSWNIRDNPARPYLEASSIKALSWNP
ncbi:MAG: hypothetical protein CFE26_02655 [Verrucomicrobiales bacterium VVV1]|nr:MAG: hypothetical protein CFE26_02655 [Verrucomicrobiales bacterium VVV1]